MPAIRPDDRRSPCGVHRHHLKRRAVPGRQQQLNSRRNLVVPINQNEPIRTLQAREVGVAGGIADMRKRRVIGHRVMHPEAELILLYVHLGVGEQLYTAHVVPMYVCQQQRFHRGGIHPNPAQHLSRVHVVGHLPLRRKRRSYAAVHDDRLVASLQAPYEVVALDRLVPAPQP